ncbi:phage scaffolding protein [Desulfosporosinus youngiae]|uniref:Phage minor structural protein n=1 Tax=Desulfosporosinus youngiae DSM 17734 TaxID=768710 RepID=H5XZV3_9FIRM|nr:phage scaffolding protein [Desulfosporosinus youngiae]EHQ92149.1 Phage minor structural protein [Desulfosporosinus youngiae DSM 17734]
MTKEQFVALGLSEEQAEKAAQASQEELKGYIPKVRFDEVNEAKKKSEEALKERDGQLADLKKSAGDNETLKGQIEQLQKDNKKKEEEYQAKLRDMSISTAIKLSVAGDAHDPDLISTLLDKTKIDVNEDGTIKSGLDDQLKALRESKAFLFVEKKDPADPQFKGAQPHESKRHKSGDGQVNPWKKETFNLTEQGRLLRDNPDLAKQLQAIAKQ